MLKIPRYFHGRAFDGVFRPAHVVSSSLLRCPAFFSCFVVLAALLLVVRCCSFLSFHPRLLPLFHPRRLQPTCLSSSAIGKSANERRPLNLRFLYIQSPSPPPRTRLDASFGSSYGSVNDDMPHCHCLKAHGEVLYTDLTAELI